VSRRTAAVLAWTLFGVSAVFGFAGLGMQIAVENVVTWHFFANDVIGIAIFFVSGVVGALIASRFPSNPIGWIFIGLVVALGISSATDGYATLSVDHGHLGGLVPWAAWYESNAFVVFFATLLYSLLLFPNGRLLTRRWRIVLWAGTAGILLCSVSILFGSGKLNDYPELNSPVGVDSPFVSGPFLPGFALFCAALVGAVGSIVLRFRRAAGVERQQLTVLTAGGVVAATTFVVSGFVGSWISQDLGIAITLAGVLAVPVSIGVAMLRYRLYEIDRVISKTLVYGALTVILGAAYAGLVLAGQAVFSSFAGGSNLAIAVSTLIVAALFLPLRSRVQRVVDRRFYRRRYDAQRTLDAFGARLREQVELERLRGDLQDVVRDTMQPAHVSLWLRRGTP
jgi:hypothetical protein